MPQNPAMQQDLGLGIKTFTVPADRIWVLHSVSVRIVASANAGNRNVMMEILNGANIRNRVASLIVGVGDTRYISWGQAGHLAITQTTSSIPMPKFVLAPAEIIKVYDFAAIDAAEDLLDVRISYEDWRA